MTDYLSTAAICETLAGPEAVRIEKQRLLPLESGEIRVRLKAAALNFPDMLMTYGKYQFKPELPFILGMEGAGVIEETNGASAPFKSGDKVLVKGKTGAFAEHITVRAAQLDPMPGHLSFEEAAAFAVTFLTAHVSLVERAKIKSGETLLVLGAGGGVGQAMVALGKALGATVIAAASSAEKLAIARESGADCLINYRCQDFRREVMNLTDGRGADVIVDPVGGTYFEDSLDCIAWAGRILIVGFASGVFGVLKADILSRKGCSVLGVRAGEFGRRDPEAGRRAFADVCRLAEEKNLKPIIHKCWPLDQVKEALQAMERREIAGKQVVLIGK
ncbi:NADPH:quinone oxidoreductase family protein [Sneathiella sp.]|uniref:NADPH:quinone oxidoreductase family protein n=1 Tax=Sneathiella sp. TaxID=1964365 RepID=UPI00356B0D11